MLVAHSRPADNGHMTGFLLTSPGSAGGVGAGGSETSKPDDQPLERRRYERFSSITVMPKLNSCAHCRQVY
jgi:hypothetical protein